ncbi:MAG: hypothetical protein ACI9VR_001085 [Cognaticolwellia sp.]|jgi:hypothetical protein
MRPPITAWLGAVLGGGSALCGVILGALAQAQQVDSAAWVGVLGSALILGSGVASFVVLWQMSPEPKTVRVRVPARALPAQELPAPDPVEPEAALDLSLFPGLLLCLKGLNVVDLSPDAREHLSAELGGVFPKLAPVTLQLLEAGERPAQWVWVGQGHVQILDVRYQDCSAGVLVSLSDHSEREQFKAELRLCEQRLSLARDLTGRAARPERSVALAFEALGVLRADVESGSPAAIERSLEAMRRVVALEGLPSLVGALSAEPQLVVRAADAALRELESMAEEWLPPGQDTAARLRLALSRSWMGRRPPRVLVEGEGAAPDAAVVALFAKVLPGLMGSSEERIGQGLDPEGLLFLQLQPRALTARVDGWGLDLDRQRALRGMADAADQALLDDMLSGVDPEAPIPGLPEALMRAAGEGWALGLSPGEPSGPGRRRVVIHMRRIGEGRSELAA